MEKIIWTDRINNEAALQRVKEERNILHTIGRRKANLIGTRRRARRRKLLLDDLKEAKRYWKLKEESQGRTLWRILFGRGYGTIARQTTTLFEVSLQHRTF
jgi:hypothetical protein